MTQVTVTANTGPDDQLVDQVFTNVKQLKFDYDGKIIELLTSDDKIKQFDMVGITLVATAIINGNFDIHISYDVVGEQARRDARDIADGKLPKPTITSIKQVGVKKAEEPIAHADPDKRTHKPTVEVQGPKATEHKDK